ncbi:MAG: hypothetical protein PHX21_01440 [bacterium]|nr:hypothetical protein [bacterium]
MKKNYFFILSICSMCFIVFTLACNAPKKKPYRYNDCWVDTVWTISQNDSIIWRHCWGEGDTLYVKTTHESGPSVGRISLSEYKDSSYKEITKDTLYNVDWGWKADDPDTVMLVVVNTSSSDTLKIEIKINKIWWYTDPALLP